MSSADRDARIAAPAERLRKVMARKIATSRARMYEPTMVNVSIADLEAVIAELRASLSREEEAKKKVEALRRYDCTTGGCGDPECCGSYGTMESQSDGEWVRFDDVRALSHSRRTAE